jgi:hypothetical protein
VEVVIIILLGVICYLLFDIRDRLPKRDHVGEALIRDKRSKDEKEKN